MAFESKTYKLVIPKSESDSNYEDHEYLLMWYGRDGGLYMKMFTDAEYSIKVDTEIINERDEDEMDSMVLGEQRNITLFAEELSLNDLGIMGGLISTGLAIRLLKDGTTERYALDSNSYSYRKSEGRFNVSFDIRLWNLK